MKKLLVAVGVLGLLSSSLYAACTGPFCYDDSGTSIGGYSYTGNGIDIPVVSSATLNGISGHPKGRTVICNNCTVAVTPGYAICTATSTVTGFRSWVVLNSTNGVVTCQ